MTAGMVHKERRRWLDNLAGRALPTLRCENPVSCGNWFDRFDNPYHYGLRFLAQAEMRVASLEYAEVFYNRICQDWKLGYRLPG